MLAFTYVYISVTKNLCYGIWMIYNSMKCHLAEITATVSPFKQYAFLLKQYSVLFKTAL